MNYETVTIEKLVHGGFGLGRLPSGQVILVPYTLPGESVIVTRQEVKKNYILGKAVQIQNRHSARIKPQCPYYEHCGGCNLQHCDYSRQLTLKREMLVDLLVRQGVFSATETEQMVADTLASACEFAYRQRIRLQVSGNGSLGFHHFRSHRLAEIKACLLAGEEINQALSALRTSNAAGRLLQHSREVEFQCNPANGRVVLVCVYNRKPRPKDREKAREICRNTAIIERIFFTGDDFMIQPPVSASGEGDNLLSLHYQGEGSACPPLQFKWEVGGFNQVNLQQNRRLIATVLACSKVSPRDSVLDLYCGMGNFSIPLATKALSVCGIEGQGSGIRCARHNASLAHLDNASFVKQPVHTACKEIAEKGKKYEIVILDPPRQGAPQLAPLLAQICRKRIVYISCDPSTLCRDLVAIGKRGFRITSILPVDMFPQTHHIETVAVLERCSSSGS